jgi:hypothetical protein
MRFLSFSNKKKLLQKDSNPERRALANRNEKRTNFAIFFSRKIKHFYVSYAGNF